jgi:molybdopterin/thiamine biosynthesis adenylyltransferase
MTTIGRDGLSPDDRFSRFELISWWDQERLRRAKILVVGAGALGNEIVKNCALVGVGNVLIADMDRVENSNLSRSVLFRGKDSGRSKAEAACESALDIYPGIRVHAWNGNVVYDLGWGAYFWADVVIAGLDNREARLAVNTGSFFARKPWVDGAIEVLDGVARVFVPGEGPCYECTMSEIDWKILESRRSCALLTRSEMEEGKVPTTPTTASIIAAVEVQEAIKLLHGMEALAGRGFAYSGLTGEAHTVVYPRKPDCYGHDGFTRLEKLGCGVRGMTVGRLLARSRSTLGPDAVLGLSRDVISTLSCGACGTTEEIYRSLGKVTEREAACPRCGRIRAPETVLTLGFDDSLNEKTFAEIGVPAFDVVTARSGDVTISYLFDGDAAGVLGGLPYEQGRET